METVFESFEQFFVFSGNQSVVRARAEFVKNLPDGADYKVGPAVCEHGGDERRKFDVLKCAF